MMDVATEQTKLEIEAGKRALRNIRNQDAIQTLRAAGLENPGKLDDDMLAIHLAFAEHSGNVPEKASYRCGICGLTHPHGRRCPNSGRGYP